MKKERPVKGQKHELLILIFPAVGHFACCIPYTVCVYLHIQTQNFAFLTHITIFIEFYTRQCKFDRLS